MTTRREILAQQGAKLSLAITLDPGASLVGRALRMQVRKFPGDTVVQLVASSADERLLVTGDREMQLEVPSSVMAALVVSEVVELWSFDIYSYSSTDDAIREAEGAFRITKATTRDTEVEPAPTVAGFVSATIPQAWTASQQLTARLNMGILETPGEDHGLLNGLGDDDHPQYLTNARGDDRYAPVGAPAAAVAAHAAELDPHPTYTTAAEAAAAAPVQSVAGRTGAVVIAVADVSGAESTANKAQPSGYASLDSGGKIPQAQLPAIAIVEYLGSVASQAAMLALSGQKGDWCTRSDSPGTWIITGTDPTLLGSWTQIVHPTDAVTSVAGRTGAVTISATDITDSSSVGRNIMTAADAAAVRTAAALGGAATLNVGTTAGTVAAGDDARLSDARTPTAHVHAASDITSGTLDAARLPAATTSTAGAVELAIASEVDTGTATDRAMTPDSYRDSTPYYVDRAADWTLAQGDANTEQQFNSGSALVLTIETNATAAISTGTIVPLLRLGSGSATIDAVAGVTLNGVDGASKVISTQYQGALLRKTGTNAWVLSGDIA